jgi:succinyl-diaminopimelate desuccinylase
MAMAAEHLDGLREGLREAVGMNRARLVELCQALVRIDSQNPPGNTGALADFIAAWIGERPHLEIKRIVSHALVTNLIVRFRTGAQGRRLVFNGHLDTFTIGDESAWTVPPLGGSVKNGRIFGRGVSDMKAGLAAAMLALDLLYPLRQKLCGELVLAFAGDEETGGVWGTQYLLDKVPEARGDAMLSGDAGSPSVVRFGEKGQMWIEVRAKGRAAHGAHVHLGQNAIVRLMNALQCILAMSDSDGAVLANIANAITAAASVSEPLSGAGESQVLRSVTINVGTIQGGNAVNLVPDKASARLDLRFPPGLKCRDIEAKLRDLLRGLDGVEFEILSQCEPNWTDADHEIVRLVLAHGARATGTRVVANMRAGFSDARFYRNAGIPSAVYGPTPYNMGAPDEHVLISDLEAVAHVHTLAAFDYLALK